MSLGLLEDGDAIGTCNVGAEIVRCAGVAGSGVIGILCACVNGSRRKSEDACLRCIFAACC